MSDFVYIFGFESPGDAGYNDRTGEDMESSASAVIEASDEAAALAWGNQVAERFLELLYRDSGMSWRDRGYVGRIAPNPDPQKRCWQHQPRVRVGEVPDFSAWLRFHGEPPRLGPTANRFRRLLQQLRALVHR